MAIDKKSKQPILQPNSRIKFDEYRNIDGIEFWEKGEMPELNGPSLEYHNVKGTDILRHDLMGYDNYEDSVMWWCIAQKNGYRYIFDEMIPGEVLKIGSITELSDETQHKLKEKKR
jgi:hypothetical protein